MATRGVFQLNQLYLYYCEVGGSSRAIREYIGNGRLAAWAGRHPHIQIHVTPRNNRHPYIEGHYRTQAVSHQVSVKNVTSWRDVQEVCYMLSNRSGRKITKITQPIYTDTPSVQGVWTPFLNLQLEPSFPIRIHGGGGDGSADGGGGQRLKGDTNGARVGKR